MMICKEMTNIRPEVELGQNAAATPPRVRSDMLLGGAKEVVIVHNGREYRLRLTQNGKLILTA